MRVFGVDWERMDERARGFTEFRENRCFMIIAEGRCAALAIDPIARTFMCSIYEQRPDVCRSLERGSGGCRADLHAKSQRPLIAIERLLSRRS